MVHARPVCFVSRLLWPPRFGGAELATHRIASRLGSRATLLCRRRRRHRIGPEPYEIRALLGWPDRWPRVQRWDVLRRAPRHPAVWHAVDAHEAHWTQALRARFGGAAVTTLHWLPRLNRRPEDWPPVRSRSEARRQREAHDVRRTLAGCDAVIAVSRYMRDLVADVVPPDRLFVVPNGLDHPAVVPPRPDGPATFLFLGRLSPGKGVGVLLDAWRRARRHLGPARLIVAGHGDTAAVERAAADPATGVSFLGFVEGEAREAAFAAASAFVHPADEPEPWGLAPLEAMARGRPVIGTAAGGSGEFMRLADAGWIVPPGDAGALADALLTAAAACVDEPRWRGLSDAALGVASGFTWERNLEQLEAVWASLPWAVPASSRSLLAPAAATSPRG